MEPIEEVLSDRGSLIAYTVRSLGNKSALRITIRNGIFGASGVDGKSGLKKFQRLEVTSLTENAGLKLTELPSSG